MASVSAAAPQVTFLYCTFFFPGKQEVSSGASIPDIFFHRPVLRYRKPHSGRNGGESHDAGARKTYRRTQTAPLPSGRVGADAFAGCGGVRRFIFAGWDENSGQKRPGGACARCRDGVRFSIGLRLSGRVLRISCVLGAVGRGRTRSSGLFDFGRDVYLCGASAARPTVVHAAVGSGNVSAGRIFASAGASLSGRRYSIFYGAAADAGGSMRTGAAGAAKRARGAFGDGLLRAVRLRLGIVARRAAWRDPCERAGSAGRWQRVGNHGLCRVRAGC